MSFVKKGLLICLQTKTTEPKEVTFLGLTTHRVTRSC